jgi:LacI family transcriptional regulator
MGSKLIQEVEDILIDQLRRLPPQQPLPPEPELVNQHNISRWTLRKAFATLEKKGLVRRIKGKGTFLAQGPQAIPIFRQRARMIGFIALNPFSGRSFSRRVAGGAFREASRNDYMLVIAQKRENETIYQMIDSPQIDGLLLGSKVQDQKLIADLARRKKPICLLSRASKIEGVDSVYADPGKITLLAVRYLYDLGHRKIAFVHSSDTELGSLRLSAFDVALRKLKILSRREWIIEKDPTLEGGEEATAELLSLPSSRRPTAIIATGRRAAQGVINVVLKAGLRVPEDMSVLVGAVQLSSSNLVPKLTQIAPRINDLGKIAVQHILERIRNPNLPTRNTLIPVELRVHESTGKPNL